MVIELDIFSGRPNPHWSVSEATAATLREIVASRPPASLAPPAPPGLGYRGFVCSDGADTWRVYRGFVSRAGAVFADASFSIERLLLQGMPHEYEALHTRVASKLKAP
jgi:hypothetical protein